VISEDRIVVGADPGGWRMISKYLLKHTTCSGAIDISHMNHKFYELSGVDIYRNHYPMRFQIDGFAAKEIEAP
jgi:23S rRNA U2552 (ribose-2'-O)-methylase RlmE/FtsJ